MTRPSFEPDDDMPPPPDDTRDDDAPNAGATMDELALRRLLHDAVRDVQPGPDSLKRLRRAVPARRTRRCQAMVGAAASMLLVGTAVPAVLHVAEIGSADPTGGVNASSGLSPGSSPGTVGLDRSGGTGGSFGEYPGGGTYGLTPGTGVISPQASVPGIVAGSPAASGTTVGDSPACARAQLGGGTAYAAAPDPEGRVYGLFRVVNVSDSRCTVSGEGQIAVSAQGSTDPAKIQVVDHTEGDPATNLPDPASEPDAVVLPPGKAYQVQFAWIPASGGGTSGCSAGPTPPADGGTDGSPGAGTTAGSGGANGVKAADSVSTAGDDGGASSDGPPDGGSASPTPPAGGITLAGVPPEGDPATASTSISGACAGTVYQTDALPAT